VSQGYFFFEVVIVKDWNLENLEKMFFWRIL